MAKRRILNMKDLIEIFGTLPVEQQSEVLKAWGFDGMRFRGMGRLVVNERWDTPWDYNKMIKWGPQMVMSRLFNTNMVTSNGNGTSAPSGALGYLSFGTDATAPAGTQAGCLAVINDGPITTYVAIAAAVLSTTNATYADDSVVAQKAFGTLTGLSTGYTIKEMCLFNGDTTKTAYGRILVNGGTGYPVTSTASLTAQYKVQAVP